MKYYYNGQLVRTSEHTYTHAVIDTKTGKAVACRNGADKAETARNAEMSLYRGDIRWYEEMIKAMKKGHRKFIYKARGLQEIHNIADDMTIEKAERRIAELKEWIDKRMSELVVVPLEAR